MTRNVQLAERAEELLGLAVRATAPVAGGDVARATKLRLSDGTSALMKAVSQAPADFFAVEVAGLRWLGEATDGVSVPEVLAADRDCVILRWIEPGRTHADAASRFGTALAHTHDAGAPRFGAHLTGPDGYRDGYIATLPLPNRPADSWPEFYAVRRVLPYLKLARDRGAIEADDAAAIEALVGRFATLLPEEPPSRLHGDLWSGNVLWGADGEPWLVDPAAHGGHRELDLAMLALFGLPNLAEVLDAYQQVHPLTDGWEERLPLHQLFPLLVHACLFGGGYGARAADTARRVG
ncbi:fructosamine kinase family protein [Nocardioides acrostichi]|uniref:Fructosamine kinase family protein n=1 Tax=Nocardioides acrostichi TaxID=2784339 RepID=A0A930UUP3_9ACTN|nr:fructosamine kinase family protein [Nocardioides acrostichi]MBF4161178.1 fructosamine kinase family protein [Nocardioides acrostichi]